MPQSKIIHHFCGCISDFYLLCYWSQNTTLPHPLLPCEVLVNEEDEIIMRFLSFFPSYSLCSPCKLRVPHTHPASAFLKSSVVSTSLDWLLVSLLPHGSMSVSQQRRIYPPDQTTVNWYQVSGVGAESCACIDPPIFISGREPQEWIVIEGLWVTCLNEKNNLPREIQCPKRC